MTPTFRCLTHPVIFFLIIALVGFGPMAAAAGVGTPDGIVVPLTVFEADQRLDNKVDPAIREMLNSYRAAQSEVSAASMIGKSWNRLFDGSLYFRLLGKGTGEVPKAEVFVKVIDREKKAELEQVGLEIATFAGDIALASLPVTRIYAAASLENVRSIQMPGRSTPSLNLSRVAAKVDAVHAGGSGLPRGYKGRGVIVGVVDSGIDWSHPDFSAAPNNTRIQWLLDYASAGTGGQATEWTKAQIDAGQCAEIDGTGSGGHGTHVAGTAAGGGRRNAEYIGMAPESDVVFVKGIRNADSNGGFSDADVANGVSYVFAKAQSVNKPAVVNLSLGGQLGPHDGTSNYEQFLSNLVRPGNIIVAAAGNEGADLIHLSYAATGTGASSASQTFWVVPQQNTPASLVDMWYNTGTISVGVAAYLDNNGQLTLLGNTQPVAPGQQAPRQDFSANVNGVPTSLCFLTIDASTTADPNNGARHVLVKIEGNGQVDLSQVVWSLYTFGTGTFDAWVVTGGRFTTDSDPNQRIMPGDNNKSVGTPSTAKKVVCVGSYVSKNSWVDLNGQTQQQLNPGNPNPVVPTVGQISYFSSRGPARDGTAKPDFVAPGEAILAALSSSVNPQSSNVLQGGGLQKLQGTSMASPHVAGIVALMLERNRYLTYENVISILKSTAAPAGAANTYGAGKVNALSALLATPPGVDCATITKMTGYDCLGNKVLAYELFDAYPNPFNPTTTLSFRIAKTEQVELAIFDVLGRAVKTLTNEPIAEGFHTSVWDGTNDVGKTVASGVYFARLSTPSFTSSRRLVLLK